MPEITASELVNSHEWERIEDLPSEWRQFCRDDLHAVQRQWVSDRDRLKDETKLKQFQERLALQWAIETGIIERLYKVDRGVTIQILQAGMEALGQFHARGDLTTDARALISDQREALEMVMDVVAGGRDLTASYMKELHQRLTLSQETFDAEDQFGNPVKIQLIKGQWKRQPNNPRRPDGSIHEYCPPEFVQDEIDQLLALREDHESLGICTEVEAAWFHHRLTQIHPFQDGNGRIARALTSAVFVKADYLVLVIRDEEHRERYLDALESADRGDLRPLVDLFADVQIGDLRDAMSAIRELRGEGIIKVTEAIAERAKHRTEEAQEQAAAVVDDLQQIAQTRLDGAKAELEQALDHVGVTVRVQVLPDDHDKQDWWSWQIIEAAKTHNYFADLDRPRRWVSLRLNLPGIEERDSRLVISFHAVGRSADLHAVTAFLTNRVASGEGLEPARWESEVIPDDAFKFRTDTSSPPVTAERFRVWLEATVENGLSAWGERL